jgi:hypothetical protein
MRQCGQTGLDREFVTFDLDTNILFNQVAQALGIHRQQNNQQQQVPSSSASVSGGWCCLQ